MGRNRTISLLSNVEGNGLLSRIVSPQRRIYEIAKVGEKCQALKVDVSQEQLKDAIAKTVSIINKKLLSNSILHHSFSHKYIRI